MYRSQLLLCAALVALAGCAPKIGADLPPFGSSVEHMRATQAWQPGDAPPPTLQGDRASRTLEHYRDSSGARTGAPPQAR